MKKVFKILTVLTLAVTVVFSVACSPGDFAELIPPLIPPSGPEIGTEVEEELKTSFDMSDIDLDIVITEYSDFYRPQVIGRLYFNNYPSKVLVKYLKEEVELKPVQVEQDGDYFRMDFNQYLDGFSIRRGTYPIKIYTMDRGLKKEYRASFTFNVSEEFFVADGVLDDQRILVMDKESNWTDWV